MVCKLCDIVCFCQNQDSLSYKDSPVTIDKPSGGACLLGKTRPVVPLIITDDQLNLFNNSNEYKSYAYTLSPKGVGLMAGKSRDKQYETLKKLHKEVFDEFECSYIVTIEIYPGSDNDLHCHGLIRFRNHSKKEAFKKLLKDKITMYRKGTYSNLIDCEFVNSFDHWSQYIVKSQETIIPFGYFPFVKIDYSFHNSNNQLTAIAMPVSVKTKVRKTKDPEALKRKLEKQVLDFELKIQALKSQISIL